MKKDGDTSTLGYFKGIICFENEEYTLYDGLKDDVEFINVVHMRKKTDYTIPESGVWSNFLFYCKNRFNDQVNITRK